MTTFKLPDFGPNDFPSSPTPKTVLMVCKKCGQSEWRIRWSYVHYHERCDSRMREATKHEYKLAREKHDS